MANESVPVTLRHIARVRELLGIFAIEMIRRGDVHDRSKFDPSEQGPLDQMQRLIEIEGNVPYGSPEYEARKALLGPMLEHHYANNSHHPEWELAQEQWAPVVGYEGLYEVSNLGRVKSLARVVSRPGERGDLSINEIIRTGHITPKGYVRVQLSKNGKPRNHMVHVLVAEAWIGSPPSPRHEVNHKSGDKTNNREKNLEWVTPSENQVHAYETGLKEPNAKYVFVCEEFDLAFVGAEQMAAALRRMGHDKIIGSGVYNAAMRDGYHYDLEFKAYPLAEEVPFTSVYAMDLFDLVEMFFDWKAASERGAAPVFDLTTGIEKYRIDPVLASILRNTAKRLNWGVK